MKKSALLASMLLVTISPCALAVETGFYAGANVLGIRQEAKKMGDSRLPGNEVVKKGSQHKNGINGSVAAGYQFDDIFRVELEYVLPQSKRYDNLTESDFYQQKIKSQRLMVNSYLSYQLKDDIALYGVAGVGYARLKSTGHYGNNFNYHSGSQNNFAWSLGAGISYQATPNTAIDFGFRHVDLGKARTATTNNSQLKAKVTSNELTLGIRHILGELYREEAPVKENIYADHVTPELRDSFERMESNSFQKSVSKQRQAVEAIDKSEAPKKVETLPW
ncbi:hypothetical protein B9T19_00205 [Ignatzschineria sp. F8392]|uniref:outer membrane protein n=1 Tax=Ignatzschineria sp. F8392 TaxID=1980117 RepID=UPI000B991D52|nr:outer membrane protein [Ignatzschineria sp. F8392]OYQ81140.1 hypothetical protein B9T19_00205 [Ignatzschineria sp. F8392]